MSEKEILSERLALLTRLYGDRGVAEAKLAEWDGLVLLSSELRDHT
jgi:hypothetical protein